MALCLSTCRCSSLGFLGVDGLEARTVLVTCRFAVMGALKNDSGGKVFLEALGTDRQQARRTQDSTESRPKDPGQGSG